MKNFNITVVENGEHICFASDATELKLKDNELEFTFENNEQIGVVKLDRAESVIIDFNP